MMAKAPELLWQPCHNDCRQPRGVRLFQRFGRHFRSDRLNTSTSSVDTTDNAADRGTVVGQNPQGQALPGETILLTVSSGNAPDAPAPPSDNNGN
jgi:hypothetical protein